MKEKSAKLPPEIVAFIKECLAREHGKSYVISVLQKIQSTFGYLPKDCMDEVSELMQIPSARVTGIATFYHFFSFVPKGKHKVTVCLGTACFVRGADKLLAKLEEMLGVASGKTSKDGLFSLETARCLGACALAPVMVVDERVYGNVKPDELPGILGEYGWKKGA